MDKVVKNNFYSFLWHSLWLALAKAFSEVNTVMPALILNLGGTDLQVGILTSIMVGIPLISQVLFAGYMNSKAYKKKYLLIGIYLRVLSLAGMGVTVFLSGNIENSLVVILIFLWITLFSVSAAFAGIPYTDILGKSIEGSLRKKFFVSRQFLSSVGVFVSAFLARSFLKKFDYPENYSLMFVTASLFLFIASMGFVKIKERATKISNNVESLFSLLKKVPSFLVKDKNLRNLSIVSNLISFSMLIVPFFIVMIKNRYGIDKSVVGSLLLSQIIGMILSNYLWAKVVKHFDFKGVFRAITIIYSVLNIFVLISLRYLPLEVFYGIFFLNGVAMSGYRISNGGLLLEITNEENRALYSGIYGTANISISILPLIYGLIINLLGLDLVLILVSLFTLLAFYFVGQLQFNKQES